MTYLHGMSIGMAAITTVCFAAAMLWFFAPAQQKSAMRLSMAVSFCVCTGLQFFALVRCREVGLVYLLLGLVLFLSAHGLFWSALAVHWNMPPAIAFSEKPPCSLVTRGPYALIRHPFYTSYMLAWLAGACAAANLYVMLTALWMFVFYYRAAVTEEARMLASGVFGAGYDQYRRRTGMFLPRLL